MPIDPRIALQAIGIQAPDYQGAMARGQQYRQNQMAMQAAEAAAQRNAMVRQRAAAVDYADPTSVNSFVQMAGAEATPYLEAARAGDNMFTARSTERRAQGEYDTKQGEAAMTQLRTVVGRVWSDPSDANLAGAAAQYPQFAADISRIAALPPEARQGALGTLVAALPGGTEFLNSVTQTYDETNLGDRVERVPERSYLPGETTSRRVGRNPNPVIVQSSQGIGSLVPGETEFTPAVGPDGGGVMPYQAPRAGDAAPGEPDARSAAAAGLRSTMESMLGYYENLDKNKGIVSTDRGALENIVASAGASLPGRVLGRTIGSDEQTERDNIQAAVPTIVASLKDLTGMSAQQMNSNVELQLFLNTLSAPDQSIQTVREAFARFGRYVDSVAGGAPAGGGGGGGGGRAALEAEARRRGLIQ